MEYTSDKVEGLTVVIETRTRGAKKTEAVRFHSAAGETGGKKVTKTISFSLHVPQPSAPVRLTDPDRQAIGGIVQAQYDLLVRRDAAGLRRLYEKAMGEEAQIYPEGVEFFKTVLDQSGKVLASPQFRMKPFDRSGLQFTIDGQRVNVSRADRSPIMESGPVEIEDELVFTQNGKEVHEKQKVRSKVGPMSEAFRMFDGRWYLALPFGP